MTFPERAAAHAGLRDHLSQLPDAVTDDDISLIVRTAGGDHMDPLATTALLGVKWKATDGNQYGDVLYLPPRVGEYVFRMIRKGARKIKPAKVKKR